MVKNKKEFKDTILFIILTVFTILLIALDITFLVIALN